jgi:DUF4097 and DUF4098 domain-containing protein YvlB
MKIAPCILTATLFTLGLSPPAAAQQQVDRGVSVQSDAYVRIYMETEGEIRISGWPRDSVDFSGTADASLPALEFGTAQAGKAAKGGIYTDKKAKGAVDLDIRVPARATVWVKTTGASVQVEDVSGGVDVYSVSGDVRVAGNPKQLYAESMGGEVSIAGESTSIRAKTGKGPITFRGAGEDVTLTTVGGRITVSGPRLRRGHFESVTGDISFDGSLEPGSSVGFQTHSGRVELTLPGDAGADCTVTTIEGDLQVDFEVAGSLERDGARGPEREFTIGTGGAQVKIQTFDGPVTIRRR